MDFDADWIWMAIFVGVMLVRFIGSRFRRAGRKSAPKPSRPPKQVTSEGFGRPATHPVEGAAAPKPLEPR